MNTKHIPKHFVIQLGALATLYVAVGSLLVLIFGIINILFPDTALYYYEADTAREMIRSGMAFVIVFFPTYLVLTRMTNQMRRRESSGMYTTLARWLIYLSFLVGGGVILGDLVTLLMFFLDGEITTRFLLKVVALLVVVGMALGYYVLDVRGYFYKRVSHAVLFGLVSTVLVITSLVFGFANIETPSEVREMRIDDNQISDLQDMQWRIEDHYRSTNKLPATLADVYSVGEVPAAPEGRAPYTYEVTGKDTYKICATFTHTSSEVSGRSVATPVFEKNNNWEHDKGLWCFERIITDKEVIR